MPSNMPEYFYGIIYCYKNQDYTLNGGFSRNRNSLDLKALLFFA